MSGVAAVSVGAVAAGGVVVSPVAALDPVELEAGYVVAAGAAEGVGSGNSILVP